MKTVKVPQGYEKQDIEWKIDPDKSAIHLMGQAPVGWQFYELNREHSRVVVTYIRKIDDSKE